MNQGRSEERLASLESKYEAANDDIGNLRGDLHQLDVKLSGAIENLGGRVSKALSELTERVASQQASVSREISEQSRTPWGTLIGFAGIGLVVAGWLGSEFRNNEHTNDEQRASIAVMQAESQRRDGEISALEERIGSVISHTDTNLQREMRLLDDLITKHVDYKTENETLKSRVDYYRDQLETLRPQVRSVQPTEPNL